MKISLGVRLAAVGGTVALIGCLAVPSGVASATPRYTDWLSGEPLSSTAPVIEAETLPNREDGEVVTNGPITFTRADYPALATIDRTALRAGQVPTPTAVKTGASGPDESTQWCYYYWNSWVGAPAPPQSGDHVGMGRANPNGVSWTWGIERNHGFDADEDTSTAYTEHRLPIQLTPTWPQPSRLIGVVNPKFKGGHYLDTNFSPFGGSSKASSTEKIRFGWLYNGFHYWDTLFSFSHTLANGTARTYTHTWPGNSDQGEFAYIDAIPSRNYTFKFRVDASVTTETEFGAAALSQLDYGTQGISAPPVVENGYVQQDRRVAWALIGYEVPDGWGVSC